MILVVDDSKAIRLVTRLTLELAGFSVDEAASGADALNKLRLAYHRLVITDYNMPDMDGLQLAQKLRAYTHADDLKIVVLSTVSDTSTLDFAKSIGVNKWLLKPFKTEDFLHSVRTILAE